MNQWKLLSPKDKYPNDKFFESIQKSFKKQMTNSLEGFEDLNKKYNDLKKDEGVVDAQ